ncbi:MAG: phospholipase D-like domain-containing protein [Gemmatimonadota bacterium]
MSTILRSPQFLSLHGLLVVLGLLTYVLTTHSLQQRRSSTGAISWVLTIALIPYVGLPLYVLFGTRKMVRPGGRSPRTVPGPDLDSPDAWPRQLAASMGLPPVASYRNLRIHADGTQALDSLWEMIDGAEREVELCTFLIGRDTVGEALEARLIVKARSGVRVRLLIDGVGRLMGGAVGLRQLKQAGVQVAVYGPILHVPFKSRTNLRNHRKMVVADGTRLWCGGRNLAAEYFESVGRQGPWKDLTFDLEGPLAAQARDLFERDWAAATGSPTVQSVETAQNAAEPFAQVIASGPDQADDTVHDLLVAACFKARSRILALTPYFVPGDALLMALSLAARQGLDVDLVIPARSNHHMADFVRHRALRGLASAGGRVWMAPYMLHGKAVVIDDSLALAGSANLDSRSLFLNYELMVAFYADADVRRFAGFIDKHREAADRYAVRNPGLVRDLGEGLVLWLAFQL